MDLLFNEGRLDILNIDHPRQMAVLVDGDKHLSWVIGQFIDDVHSRRVIRNKLEIRVHDILHP